MYNRKEAVTAKNVTLDWLLQRVTEYDIYSTYIGSFKIGVVYNSPLRKDKNPSFAIYKGRKGNLMFKDHGVGTCGNVIKFVSLKTGITNYNDILLKIIEDLKIGNKTKLNKTKVVTPTTNTSTIIGVVRQPFTEEDHNYWSQFCITDKTLKKFNVNSIKYYLCNGIVKMIYHNDNPMFAYKVNDHFKIYRPLADKYSKWRNNLNEHDIQGYEQLPQKGNILFITKSMKDIMCLYEMGFYAISPGSETTFISDCILQDLYKRFKRIIILFDRDVAGVKNSRLESLKTGLEAIFVHKKYKAKDISDAIKLHGIVEIKKWLNKTLKL